MVNNLQMRLRSFRPLLKLLHGLAFGSIMLANSLPVQADPTKNIKIIQQQVNEDESTFKTLRDKALALEKEGKNKEAAENWERFIKLAEKNFGPIHPVIAPGLNKLGYLYYVQSEYNKAEALYVQVLAINEKALDPDHPDVALSLNNLAFLYSKQRK